MKLRPEYETVRFNLMSRVPSPSLNECLNELLRKEQCQITQHALKQRSLGNPIDVAYVATGNRQSVTAYVAKGNSQGMDLSKIQCYGCKNFGHYASQCKQKFCNYCKASGHVIADCRRRPHNCTPRAYHANTVADTSSCDIALASVISSQAPAPSRLLSLLRSFNK